jgi:hypothetical protein
VVLGERAGFRGDLGGGGRGFRLHGR